MTRIQLEAASDLVRRLAQEKQPVKAVLELIWNGLDVDAHRVTVGIGRDAMDAVASVTRRRARAGRSTAAQARADFGLCLGRVSQLDYGR